MSARRAGGPIQAALSDSLARYGERTALVGASTALSYSRLAEQIDAARRLLHGHLQPERSARVGYCLANSSEYVVLYFSSLFAGHLPLLLDEQANTGEIDAIRSDCGLDALVVDPAKAAALSLADAGVPIPLADGIVLLPLHSSRAPRFTPQPSTQVCRFTSGTTGRPKAIEFSGESVVAAARQWGRGTGMIQDDRVLCLAALSNGLAFNTSLLATFLVGGELHFLEGMPLTRTVARRIAAAAITRLVAFPALYRHFAAPGGPDREELASLTHAISAGAPLRPDVREGFRGRYGVDISDYYGIAETGPCTFERDPAYPTGQGEPLPGVEIKIGREAGDAGIGEVLVRTESMASGYLNHPGLFAERLDADGFYRSGDRGQIVDGRLHLVGRTHDHINVAGRKIDPAEIVTLVSALEGVREAVVLPDEDFNRETFVHLVIVPASRDLTTGAVADACRSRLAPYKVPGRISFVSEIPRNGIGKARLGMLREQLRDAASNA